MKPAALPALVVFLLLIGLMENTAAQEKPAGLPADAGFAGDVAYVENGHERQKLDIAFSKEGGPRPLLVWIHGGAYMGGDKAENHAIWGGLMEEGYAVATINYRFSGNAKWPAQITDCKAAIRYLRAHAKKYNLAPGRIAVWGSSAGGHLAALVGVTGGVKSLDVGGYLDQSSAVSCAVDLFGPADFETMPQFSSPDSPEARLWGRPTSEAPGMARSASPITYLSRDTPPLLILHGDADGVVPLSQSRQLHTAMEKAGAPGELVILSGVGHSHVEVWMQKRDHILAFFERHLRKDTAVGP